MDPKTVAAHDFGPGTAAHLGGESKKTLHTGPDGNTWMAKPEWASSVGGARVHAEVSRSSVYARVGLPAVPVYATQLNGVHAAVQPLVTGASPLSPNTAAWTQADVDSIVRLHVGSWAVGDHDVHFDNMLRTAEGGLFPVDGGAAWKHYGRDRLAMDYNPHGGALVYHQAYTAHLSGCLADGVTINPAAAHPVIKKFESIPDSEYRAMLHQAAHTGAAQADRWAPEMRSRAAKIHGIAEHQVTTAQVAEAFLDHAVERKNRLRSDFADFYNTQLKLPAAQALKYMGS
jgi:hypothetical protein